MMFGKINNIIYIQYSYSEIVLQRLPYGHTEIDMLSGRDFNFK